MGTLANDVPCGMAVLSNSSISIGEGSFSMMIIILASGMMMMMM